MKVLFDEQIFLLQKRGGVSRYFVELIRQFATTPSHGVEPILCFKKTTNNFLLGLSKDLNLGITLSCNFKPVDFSRSSYSSRCGLPRVDLIHHTFYSKFFWAPRFLGPRVATHFDMIPEIFNESRFGINPHLSKHWYFKNVNQILAISHSAKSDLKNIWPDVETSVAVTYLGAENFKLGKMPRTKGNVIYVGSRAGYKDAQALFRAFAATPESLRTKLEFLGGGNFTQSELDLIDELGISSQIMQRDVSDDELAMAYSTAHVFVFPSRYEGFGLPVLEALQSGCRAILSDAAALVEVAGDCADYFSAGDLANLTSILTTVLSEDPNTNPYLNSGLLRAERFSWSQTAKQTAQAYQSLI